MQRSIDTRRHRSLPLRERIPYLGYDLWMGPQSQWWLQGQINRERKVAAAVLSPYSYLSLATTSATKRSRNELHLQGMSSPMPGVQLTKRFGLSASRADTVDIQASACNIGHEPIALDFRLNTRVASSTRVIVPVAAAADIRVQPPSEAGTVTPTYRLTNGVFALRADVRQDGLIQRGKWLAAFGWLALPTGEVLVIGLVHQPLAVIHPEQEQVELYSDAPPQHPKRRLLGCAPYRQLAPRA